MKKPAWIFLAVALAAALPAVASEKLARDKQCMGCHDVRTDGAAPSFQRISANWQNNKDAVRIMSTTIRKGSDAAGGPHWGKARMPNADERPEVSEAEARQIVHWILNLK